MRLLLLTLTLAFSMPAIAGELATKRPEVSNFSLQTLKGERFKFASVKGKVVVISFWASWCKPCIQELGFLKKLKKKLDNGFVVLAVSTDDPNTMASVRKIVRRKRLNMPILLDTQGSLMGEMNARGTMPYSVYVDVKGRIAAKHDGFASGDEPKIEKIVKALLKESGQKK